MDLFKKYCSKISLFPIVSDYVTNYLHFINEKPLSSVLAPLTLTLFSYYVYVYVRKFYPICVNCWFCNANFKVAFENRFEFTCIECGQFNGFKEDGNYSKIIPEQHDLRYNRTIFSVTQNDIKDNKNGLCHKCNIIQEIKMKQLASFTPTKEKNFDKEVEQFKENLEQTLQLCFKCNMYTQKILSIQEQRYCLKSSKKNNQIEMQDVNNWPNICSLCLSFIVILLSSNIENYLYDWASELVDISISYNNIITETRSIGMISLSGILCQIFHCLYTMDKLNTIVILLWSLLFTINNFEIFKNFKPKLFLSIIIVLLTSVSIIKNYSKKQKIRQTSIKLDNEKYQFSEKNYYDISKNCVSPKIRLQENHFLPGSSNQYFVRLPRFKVARVLNEKVLLEAISKSIQYTTRDDSNGSIKNNDESEMMDIDYKQESPKKAKKTLHKTVNNLFQGMKLDDKHSFENNVIRPPKLFVPTKRNKFTGYAESTAAYYPLYSVKDDYEFDTQSVYSQHQYRSPYSSICHQPVLPPLSYYMASHHHQSSPLNLSHSSNVSNSQYVSEWPRMLLYSIPGVILLTLQCYLLYDIKDFMKQK